jgi:hypothetical protein
VPSQVTEKQPLITWSTLRFTHTISSSKRNDEEMVEYKSSMGVWKIKEKVVAKKLKNCLRMATKLQSVKPNTKPLKMTNRYNLKDGK